MKTQTKTQHGHLLDHEYDGIQEFDNPTPGWWTWLFVATILLCFPYVIMYHFGDWGWDIHAAHSQEAAENARLRYGTMELASDEPTILRYMGDPEWMPVGESVFKTNCVRCHGADAAGMTGAGVNLTDDYYKNVKTLADIASVVANGANNGAMPAHKKLLLQNDIVMVSAYVATLRGKNLPGRGHDGELIAPFPKPTPRPRDGVEQTAGSETATTKPK